jgi:hypothetical protein
MIRSWDLEQAKECGRVYLENFVTCPYRLGSE